VPWTVLFKMFIFWGIQKSKMADTARHSVSMEPYGKMKNNCSRMLEL